MKTPEGLKLSIQRRSSWPLLFVVGTALAFGTVAWAQNAVSTLAGSGSAGSADGTGTAASFQFTVSSAAAVDTLGNIYVADVLNNTIRKITSAGVVTTFASGFNNPRGIAVDGVGNVFVADTNSHVIRKVTSGGVVSLLAGTIGTSGTANGVGVAARFNQPFGIACDRAGAGGAAVSLFVADTGNHTIRQIDVATTTVTTLAGTAGVTPTVGTITNGVGAAALFNHPDDIVSNSTGTTLYVADTFSHAIRQITVPGATVSTLAGSGTAGSLESAGTAATFNNPTGIALDASGNVLVTDTFNHTIRHVTPGGVTSLYAGMVSTSGTTNGLATAAKFNYPSGVVYDSVSSSVYVIDTNNQLIRRIAPAVAPTITGLPQPATAAVGGTATFKVTASGSAPMTYQWQINPGGLSTFSNLSNFGSYSGTTTDTLTITGVTSTMNNDKFQVVVSNGIGSPVTSSTATLTVSQAPVFTSATTTNFSVGQTTTFNVTVTGSPTPTISYSGNFPPWASFNTSTNVMTGSPSDASGSPYTFTFTATSVAGTATQTFTATVLTGPTITVQPAPQVVVQNQNATFSVGATTNGGVLTYQWQRQAVGTIGFVNISDSIYWTGTNSSNLMVYTPNQAMSGDQYQVVVSSGIGSPITSNPAMLTIAQGPMITSLGTPIFVENQYGTFQISATGSPAPTFTVTAGALPYGLSLAPSTGLIAGTPQTGTSTGSPYTVQVTASNGVGTPASQLLYITVSGTPLLPGFTTQPISVTAALGQTVTFTVIATGSPTPTLQWERMVVGSGVFTPLVNDANFSGVNTATLTITNPTSGMNGEVYRVLAANTSGTTASSTATLTLAVGTTISTLAGQGGYSGTADGSATAARFNGPAGLAIDTAGTLYVADSSNHTIRKVMTGGTVTTLAGSAGVSGSLDGLGAAARFNGPAGIAVSNVGTVYVADTYNHTIRMITPDGSVTTIAGLAGNPGTADGTGNLARFSYPYGIAVDSAGTVYVADTFNHTIRRIQSGGIVTTLAGFAGARGLVNGTGTGARFAYPFSLALDYANNLYVADAYNHAIRRVDVFGNVSTFAGTLGVPGTLDGIGTAAQFNQPQGVGVSTTGTVYVADTFSNTIRSISAAGVVTTIAGTPGSLGSTDGVGAAARFYQPAGIAVDATGNIYIADTRNHAIRRSGTVMAPTITTHPRSTAAPLGGAATFTVAATGSPTPSIFTWMRQAVGTFGYVPLTNDGVYSGTNTATLTVSGVTEAMNGDQFQVVVSNLISPNATSNAAMLSIGTAPVITSAATASFQATIAGTFTVTATGTPTPTFSMSPLPSWATLDANTGVLSGTPPDTSGSPFTITVTASNGITATQTLTLTVLPAVIAPTITNQPGSVAVNQGGSAVLSVTASGTAPLTYQWSRNGAPIAGATGASLNLTNLQTSMVGNYTVTVSNSAGAVTSQSAAVIVNTVPAITQQPLPQTVQAGSVVTFSVSASGGSSFNYQWRKNGVAIAGANGATLTLTGVTAFDAGTYDVQVGNALGVVGSSLAQLTVASTPTAPIITAQPASRTIVASGSTTLTVGATGSPTPSYQWRKNGATIGGANAASYVVTGTAANAGLYDVVISNSAGSVTSSAAVVRVIARSYAGYYFGSFGGGQGTFALAIRDDNTGVFLGYLPGQSAPVMSFNFTVDDSGAFSFSQAAIATGAEVSANAAEPARAAALGTVSISGSIANDGTLSGVMSGGANAALSASRATDTGVTQSVAGFYRAGASTGGAVTYTIAGPSSQAFSIVQSGGASDGGTGSVTVNGAVNVVTNRSLIASTIAPSSGLVTANSTGAVAATYAGGSEAVLSTQRLVNISSRARVASGDNVAIAGFVIAGEVSKPVLIRAVGPTIGAAPFNVSGALASPRLELYRGQVSLAVNAGIAADRAAIDAAGRLAGAFDLGASGADAAILTTLAPGAYTAVVSSTTGTAGVALVEVYDLSGAAAGQKLLNIATRASSGTGDNVLIAGFVVPPGAAKRVLVRGVGPGLTPFGVSGVIAQPVLQVISGGSTVAQNTGYTTSADRDAIVTASAQVGAFGLANNDSAVIVTLAPGNYTALVSGSGGTTGVALIEVYELP